MENSQKPYNPKPREMEKETKPSILHSRNKPRGGSHLPRLIMAGLGISNQRDILKFQWSWALKSYCRVPL